jgi:hypothetical protein
MLERAAHADALAQVYSQLADLPLVEGVPLSAWPGWTPQHEIRLREKAADACVYSAFHVEPNGRARVLVTLPLSAVQIEEEGWPRLVGGVIIAVGRADTRVAGTEAPPGWEHVPSRCRELAVAAAQEIVRAALTRRITRDIVNRGFALPPDDMVERVNRALTFADPVFEPYQLCRVSGRLTLSSILPGLAAGPRDTTSGSGAPVSDVATTNGFAVAPQNVSEAGPGGEVELPTPPSWAQRRLRATGRGAGGTGADAESKHAAAEQAARIDALIKMAREIDKLPLTGDYATVRDFVLAHPDDDDAWSAYLTAGRTVEIAWEADTCTITLEWDLGTLWALIEHR